MADKKTIEIVLSDLGKTGGGKAPEEKDSEEGGFKKEGDKLGKIFSDPAFQSAWDFFQSPQTEPSEKPEQDGSPNANFDASDALKDIAASFENLDKEIADFEESVKTSSDLFRENADEIEKSTQDLLSWEKAIEEFNNSQGPTEFQQKLAALGESATQVYAAFKLTEKITHEIARAFRAWNDLIDYAAELTGGFSAAVQTATAEMDIQKIRDQIEASNQIGGDAAALVNTKSEVASDLRETGRLLIHIFEPILSGMGEILSVILKVLNYILEKVGMIVDGIEYIAEYLSGFLVDILGWIPIIGDAVRAIDRWLRSDNEPNSNLLEETEDALFGTVEIPVNPFADPFAKTPPKNPPADGGRPPR